MLNLPSPWHSNPLPFYDFQTGNVHAVAAFVLGMRGEQILVFKPGRVIDNFRTVTDAVNEYGTVTGINSAYAPGGTK